MTNDRAATWVLLAWVGMVGLISARYVLANQAAGKGAVASLPPPGAYLGSAVAFTMLWGGTFIAPSLATALAVGLDIAAFASPYLAGKPGILDQTATWVQKVSPTPPATGATS